MKEQRRSDAGLLLSRARRAAGLTQQQLADAAAVSLGALRDLEQGRSRPRARLLDRLADALRLDQELRSAIRRGAQRPAPDPVAADGPLRILLLGPLRLVRGSQSVGLGTGRHRIVLARLALTPGRTVPVEELLGLLWKDDKPATATNVLQSHISRLRRLLGASQQAGDESPVRLMPGGYALHAGEERLDLMAFREALAQSRSPGVDPRRGYDVLTEALALWRSENPADDVPELEGHPLVVELVQQRAEEALRLAHFAEALRRQGEVVPLLRTLCRRHPWHESLHARLMTALAATGQQAAALEVYDSIRRRLTDELGVDPCAELLQTHRSVLHGDGDPRRPVALARGRQITPWQAPAPPQDFVGRAGERARLGRLLRRPAAGAAVCCVISGMADVGKTALALRIAFDLRADYPDGQIYIDLRGANDQPVDVAYALARLLRALGVNNQSIPADPDEAAGLYRSVLSERRVLVILDNAHDTAQVRPLLAAPGGSAVLATSRDLCVELEDAELLTLPPLDIDEAVDMLTARARSEQTADHWDDVRALAEACGRLPLALRIVGGRLAARLDRSVADLLGRLAGERSAIEELRIGGVAVTASFELSYRALGPTSARAFRLAALIPGAEFSPTALASLLPMDEREVTAALGNLVSTNLLQQLTPDRYRYHDLLRAYATHHAEKAHGAAERSAALGRLFAWYLARTAAAMRLVYPSMVRLPFEATSPGTPSRMTTPRGAGSTRRSTTWSRLLRPERRAHTGLSPGSWPTNCVATSSSAGTRWPGCAAVRSAWRPRWPPAISRHRPPCGRPSARHTVRSASTTVRPPSITWRWRQPNAAAGPLAQPISCTTSG
ncbi:BTAD domain-containing putative transcriptional regulator [Krasilnikovia sp. MM14-A1259]|uniref:BTAD domain-containing putative transcriptional regulator n=1 Tax=Krasilnikovia sp. MM14-A1259 TaxID=3373539 RepID=UPI0037F315AD